MIQIPEETVGNVLSLTGTSRGQHPGRPCRCNQDCDVYSLNCDSFMMWHLFNIVCGSTAEHHVFQPVVTLIFYLKKKKLLETTEIRWGSLSHRVVVRVLERRAGCRLQRGRIGVWASTSAGIGGHGRASEQTVATSHWSPSTEGAAGVAGQVSGLRTKNHNRYAK